MLNDLKAGFSYAYVRAVAHAAGYFVEEAGRTLDADGVDLTIIASGPGGTLRSPRLDVQLKATARNSLEDPFSFDLPVKNYEELSSTMLQVPRILIVVVVPEDTSEWIEADEQQLILRRCGYWLTLRGAPTTQNTATVRVRLQRAATFHVDQVREIMARIGQGDFP